MKGQDSLICYFYFNMKLSYLLMFKKKLAQKQYKKIFKFELFDSKKKKKRLKLFLVIYHFIIETKKDNVTAPQQKRWMLIFEPFLKSVLSPY